MRTRVFLCITALMTPGCLPGLSAPPSVTTNALAAQSQIAVGKSPHGMAAAQGFVYNSNTGSGTISVIDATSDKVVKEITIDGGKPGNAKAFHDGRHVLVLDSGNQHLLVIDPKQDHAIVQRIAVGEHPDRVVIGPDDQTVLVSLAHAHVQFLTFSGDRTLPPSSKEIAVGNLAGEGGMMHRAADFNGGWAIVPNSADQTASLIDLASGQARQEAVGNDPGPVGLGLVDGKATVGIVGNKASHTVTLLPLAGGPATTLSGVGQSPTDMAVDTARHHAFLSMAGSNEVTVIDYVAQKVVQKLAVGKRPVHVYLAPEGNEVWVGNDDGASVSVIDAQALTLKGTVTTGNGHHKMAFANGKVYVSNIKDSSLSVIRRF